MHNIIPHNSIELQRASIRHLSASQFHLVAVCGLNQIANSQQMDAYELASINLTVFVLALCFLMDEVC